MKAKPGDKYTADRFRWLDQVGADPDLTPLCFRAAYAISTFINRTSGDAWPSQELLAAACHTTDRSIRDALTRMKAAGHLQQTGRGGNGKTSRYKPILKDAETRKPASTFEGPNPEASFHVSGPIPGSFRHKTRKKSTAKRGSQLPTIPLIEPSEEPFERKSLSEFENWWCAYPKKVGKIPAQKIYTRVIKNRQATHAELLAGAMRYSAQRTGEDPKFTKEPKNWLAEGRWNDEASPASQHHRKSETPSRADSAMDGMRGYLEDPTS
jgi:hypothetical protein